MGDNKISKINLETIREPFWALEIEDAYRILGTGINGLDEREVLERRKIFGSNRIELKKRAAKLKIFWSQLKSPLILALIVAGAVTFFLEEWVDAAVIFAAVAVNTILGFYQENKAESALEFLKTYIRTRSRVRRGGKELDVDAEDLVPGDIIRVSQGDRVPADARLIFVNNFETDEAVLTGESLPENKKVEAYPASTGLEDRSSMVFEGTLAIGGFADAVITATGKFTEFGKIAALVAGAKRELTPLQKAISRFVVRAGIVLAILILTVFTVGIYFGEDLLEMFLISVAIAVSAVPEGLPVALTVILAVGVERLARRRGVVRRLLAAETLGSTTLILTDKTGTLTQAKMELTAVLPWGDNGNKKNVLKKAVGNADLVIENPEDDFKKWRIFGRPLETALVLGAAKEGVFYAKVNDERTIADRLPFSSEYKFSATVSVVDSRLQLVILGAPEIIAEFTTLNEDGKKELAAEVEKRAESGERIIGVAHKEVKSGYIIPRDLWFEGLTFGGLFCFRDPLRPKVADAIKKIGLAGVRTIIVTGDHKGTAESVARELGMVDPVRSQPRHHVGTADAYTHRTSNGVNDKGAVITGQEMKYLTREELYHRADEVSVYARVTPEEKLMITRMYKEKGEIVAVTGDGINDAPALEEANIGVAVGSGTDVTKGAADLVLLDDNFETLVAAIEEGRRVLDNVRKVIVYLLSSALDELLLIGGALIMGLPLPLNALQILFVNFFSDSFPAIALAFEDSDGLGKKPRKLDRNLFDREMRFLITTIGFATSAFLFALYYFLFQFGFAENLVRTFIFASFATYSLFLVFSVRSLEKSIFTYNPLSNLYLVAGVLVGILLTAVAVYLPVFNNIFGTIPLPFVWILGVLGVGVLNIFAIETGKWLFRKHIL